MGEADPSRAEMTFNEHDPYENVTVPGAKTEDDKFWDTLVILGWGG